jgi:hypothetical protein
VAVGWDRPLQTFYVQIFTSSGKPDGEDDIHLWVGTAPGELPTPASVLDLVRAYALIEEGLEARLATVRL